MKIKIISHINCITSDKDEFDTDDMVEKEAPPEPTREEKERSVYEWISDVYNDDPPQARVDFMRMFAGGVEGAATDLLLKPLSQWTEEQLDRVLND